MDPVGLFVEDTDIVGRWGRLKCLATGVSLSLRMSNLWFVNRCLSVKPFPFNHPQTVKHTESTRDSHVALTTSITSSHAINATNNM